ncbi:HAD-IA family hydrolase [Candidatus Woesearchaeota archaeon]|nr:HAD-IA family hydrolase [Candidatus Woesearchaeota archaeon]
MIKAILFDSGGVIVDQRLWFERLNKIFRPKNKKKFWREINIEAIPLCKNLISEKVFWKRIAKLNKKDIKKIPKNLWRLGYENLTKVKHDVLAIAQKLKKKYKIGIVSNSIAYHEKINKKRGTYNLFDAVILSHKVGLTKNNKKIFFLAAKKLKVKPKECIFIDDVKDFVDVAKSVGMAGIVFKNSKQLKSDFKKFIKF